MGLVNGPMFIPLFLGFSRVMLRSHLSFVLSFSVWDRGIDRFYGAWEIRTTGYGSKRGGVSF